LTANRIRVALLALAATAAACAIDEGPPPPVAYAPSPPPQRTYRPASPPAPSPPLAPEPAPRGRLPLLPRSGDATSIGCFKDQGDPGGINGRDLDGLMMTLTDMTTEACISACSSRGFNYAGTQSATQCFCGNSYGRSGPSTGCTYKCAGNANQTCGGFWANSVYQLLPGGSPAPPGQMN
jgi:hypothetical protein